MSASKWADIREDKIMEAHSISLQGFLEDAFEFDLLPFAHLGKGIDFA